MNGTFEDKLLSELKAQMAVRPSGEHIPARRRTGRRLLMAAGVVGVAAAAVVAVPWATGSGSPAYAVTKNADGSVTLTLREFRAPETVERDLAATGVRADIAYMPLGKRCDVSRYRPLAEDQANMPTKEEMESDDPAKRATVLQKLENRPSGKAVRLRDDITIYPRRIAPGWTLVIDIAENPRTPTADDPGVAWQFSAGLTDGPVRPCRLVDDPSAFRIGDATPPPGS
ncbi:hypothetical protein DQ384_11370 [Sphaerisporangium album]|uniref:Uncharacterized protein n=1 Tax=Sphaerisporangium album TaxID=509200 RepID=A0A367FLN7_9ACTN|nr:hypothetical protein [Sphaerisporangium album]RCG31308.1 hypothetical protein DQ384_11370 [Sphaerisporangium album]